MRHFLVLGFATNSKKGKGRQVYLGTNRDEALEKVNGTTGVYVRRELYELAVPQIRRHVAVNVDDSGDDSGDTTNPDTVSDDFKSQPETARVPDPAETVSEGEETGGPVEPTEPEIKTLPAKGKQDKSTGAKK